MDAQSATQVLVGMSDRDRRGVVSSSESKGRNGECRPPPREDKNLHMVQMSSHLGSWQYNTGVL